MSFMTMTKRPKSLRLRLERLERKSAVARKGPPLAAHEHLPPPPGRPGFSLGARLLYMLICSVIVRDDEFTLTEPPDGVLRRWLDELLSAGCITLSTIDGVTSVHVMHLHKHQTIQ
jgi:hypothetical protein